MAVRKKAAPPAGALNVVTEAHAEQFDEYIRKWQTLLNLRDWRIVRDPKRERQFMAVLLSVEHEHKLAKYRIGSDFRSQKVTPEALESTALHELLHLLLRPMLDTAMADGEHSNAVAEYEHAALIVLEGLLMAAYGGKG